MRSEAEVRGKLLVCEKCHVSYEARAQPNGKCQICGDRLSEFSPRNLKKRPLAKNRIAKDIPKIYQIGDTEIPDKVAVKIFIMMLRDMGCKVCL